MDFGVEKIDFSTVHFTPQLCRAIPATIVRKYRVLPVFDSPGSLCIALPDASKLEVIDELIGLLHRSLEVRQAGPEQLDIFIQKLYGDDDNETHLG